MGTKTCSKCKVELPLENFCNDSKSKDGKQSNCKSCKSKWMSNYYKENPEKRPKRKKEKNLERYYKNKVNMNFSRRMRKSLNGLKNGMSWESLVGYTIIDLKEHLEKQFTDGMTWENYGEWHIDHVKPICKFNINSVDCEDFKTCWSLDNLQPLWAIDNLKKGGNLE